MTGQEAANLVKTFNDSIGITGAVLSKMDGDTRGGAALTIREVQSQKASLCDRARLQTSLREELDMNCYRSIAKVL